jgi:hypothetical protein
MSRPLSRGIDRSFSRSQIQKRRVVSGGDNEAGTDEGLELLKKSGDDATQLAVIGRVSAFLADGIELIKQQDTAVLRRDGEDGSEVARGVAEKRRYDRTEVDNRERSPELISHRLCSGRLARARWPDEEEGAARSQAVVDEEVFTAQLKMDLAEQCADGIRQQEVREADLRITRIDQVAECSIW